MSNNTTPEQGTSPDNVIPTTAEAEGVFSVFQDFDSDSEGGMQLDAPPPPFEFAAGELGHEVQQWADNRDGAFPPRPNTTEREK